MSKQKFYTLQEVAKLIKVSERSMYRYIKSGRLKATKVGQWRVEEKDFQRFIKKSSSQSSK